MDIANKADRAINERYSQKSPETEAHENNERMLDKLEKIGVGVENVRGRI